MAPVRRDGGPDRLGGAGRDDAGDGARRAIMPSMTQRGEVEQRDGAGMAVLVGAGLGIWGEAGMALHIPPRDRP
ncbi:MAG TPA: hypothetical protein VGN83_00020 [Falsiroseomonas sp.]|nr:hypothetical protein [Falsiroseomonas sp.]